MGGLCEPSVDSSSQWGGWPRASPGHNAPGMEGSGSGAASSNNSLSGNHTGDASRLRYDYPRVCDMPTKRNLQSEFFGTGDTRTGESYRQDRGEVSSPGKGRNRHGAPRERDLRDNLERRCEYDLRHKLLEQQQYGWRDDAWEAERDRKGKDKLGTSAECHAPDVYRAYPPGEPDMHGGQGRRRGTYRRKPRQVSDHKQRHDPHGRFDYENRKRRPKQVWVAKGGSNRQTDHETFIRKMRQKTSSVFDRISDRNDTGPMNLLA